MRSTEDGALLRLTDGDALFGVFLGNSALGSVGVGGVTNVVGVSVRLGGVAGRLPVLILGLPLP